MNQTSENTNDIDQIEQDIRTGKIKMRSRAYFIAQYGLTLIGILLLLGFCIYLGSFAIFMLRANGIFLLPSLGWRGLQVFLHHIPWFLLVFVGLFIVLLEWLSRRFTIIYRRPLLYSSIALLTLVALGSVLVEQTPIHPRLMRRMSSHPFPFISPFYNGYSNIHPTDFHVGLLLEKQESRWVIQNRFRERLNVLIDRGTKFPFGKKIDPGARLLIIGERKNTSIHAEIIRKIEPIADPIFQ